MSEKNYSEAIQRLEEIVGELERGGKDVEQTLALFEEGAGLLKFCQSELASAEGRLAELRLGEAEEMVSDSS